MDDAHFFPLTILNDLTPSYVSLTNLKSRHALHMPPPRSSHAASPLQAVHPSVCQTGCGWGHYLGDDSLAAPAGVVEALDEERQELPPDQLPAGDDPGSLPADAGAPV